MKKTTKIISLLLTLVMMLTVVVPVTASTSFSDVSSDHTYYEAITNLTSEGILNGMGDGTFAPEGPVTRAQFTKTICYALSMGEITYSDAEKSIFTDVAPEHWAANNIVTAYKQGIINGMGDGTFAPEAGVNYEQAVKMVVCALGYTEAEANAKGGYPGGYMSIASSAKILKGIKDAMIGKPMTRGGVAQLIDSMLDADQIVDGEKTASIREERNQGKRLEGKVVAGYGVALEAGYVNNCGKNEIAVRGATGETIFDVTDLKIDIYDFLGRSVIVYYEEEAGMTDIATNIALQPKKNEEVKIDFNMIADYDSTSIEYYTDENYSETETVDYDSNIDILFNGQSAGANTTLSALIQANQNKPGHITLVSSEANSSADAAFVKAYETVIVQKIDKVNEKVFGKNIYTQGAGLDLSDNTKEVIITSGGKAFDFESISENHVLSVASDVNNKRVEVLVAAFSTKSGTIKEMPDLQRLVLSTDNKTYNVIKNASEGLPYCSNNASGNLETGKSVTLYFDAFGNVIRYEVAAAAALSYGYLSQLEEDDDLIQVAVYKATSSNSTPNFIVYDLADRITINGTVYKVSENASGVKSALRASADKQNPQNTTLYEYAQPIRYSVSKSNSNVIDNIITSAKTGQIVDSLNIVSKTGNNGVVCEANGQRFAGGYSISTSTPVILIPHTELAFSHDTATVASVDKFQTKQSSYFKQGTSYYVKFANSSALGVASCVYVYASTNGQADIFDAAMAPYIITNIGSKVNPKDDMSSDYYTMENIATGEPLYCYRGTYNITNVNMNNLEIGDVVRVVLDDKDYIEAIEYAADRSAIAVDITDNVSVGSFAYTINGNQQSYTYTQGEGTGTAADYCTRIGVIKTKDGNSFILAEGYTVGGASELINTTSNTPIYEVDLTAQVKVDKVTSGNLVSSGGATTSAPMSRVMIYTKDGVTQAVVIFKYKDLRTPQQ